MAMDISKSVALVGITAVIAFLVASGIQVTDTSYYCDSKLTENNTGYKDCQEGWIKLSGYTEFQKVAESKPETTGEIKDNCLIITYDKEYNGRVIDKDLTTYRIPRTIFNNCTGDKERIVVEFTEKSEKDKYGRVIIKEPEIKTFGLNFYVNGTIETQVKLDNTKFYLSDTMIDSENWSEPKLSEPKVKISMGTRSKDMIEHTTAISACATLANDTEYALNGNVQWTSGNCFIINNNHNTSFDGTGYMVNKTFATAGRLFSVTKNSRANITIKNLEVNFTVQQTFTSEGVFYIDISTLNMINVTTIMNTTAANSIVFSYTYSSVYINNSQLTVRKATTTTAKSYAGTDYADNVYIDNTILGNEDLRDNQSLGTRGAMCVYALSSVNYYTILNNISCYGVIYASAATYGELKNSIILLPQTGTTYTTFATYITGYWNITNNNFTQRNELYSNSGNIISITADSSYFANNLVDVVSTNYNTNALRMIGTFKNVIENNTIHCSCNCQDATFDMGLCCVSLTGSSGNTIQNNIINGTGRVFTAADWNSANTISGNMIYDRSSTMETLDIEGTIGDTWYNNSIFSGASTLLHKVTAGSDHFISNKWFTTAGARVDLSNKIKTEGGIIYEEYMVDANVTAQTGVSDLKYQVPNMAVISSPNNTAYQSIAYGLTNSSGITTSSATICTVYSLTYNDTMQYDFMAGRSGLSGSNTNNRICNDTTININATESANVIDMYLASNSPVAGNYSILFLNVHMDVAGLMTGNPTVNVTRNDGTLYGCQSVMTLTRSGVYNQSCQINQSGDYYWCAYWGNSRVDCIPFTVYNSADYSGIDTKVDTIDANVDTLLINVTTIEGIVNDINGKVDFINITVGNLSFYVNASDIAQAVWGYNLTNNATAEQNIVNSGTPMFAITILLMAFVFFYIAFAVDGEQFELMRLMFVFVGIYFIMIGMQTMLVVSNDNANAGLTSLLNTSLQIVGYLFIVMIFFLLIQIIWNIYNIMANRKIKII